MKPLLLTLLLCAGLSGIAQTENPICKERGHVMGGWTSSTLLYCPPYQIDEKDFTIMVYPDCNSHSTICSRCGMSYALPSRETRDTIWKRTDFTIRPVELPIITPPDTVAPNLFLTDSTYDTTTWKDFITDSTTRVYLAAPLKIAEILPTSKIIISGKNTSLHLDFKGDSLVVSGDMALTEGAQKFIDFCRQYTKTKIDSLETELGKCKEIKNRKR